MENKHVGFLILGIATIFVIVIFLFQNALIQIINSTCTMDKAMFQSSLMEKMEIGKVKATRLLDKLEAKQIIERKRRGMNNIVVLKD